MANKIGRREEVATGLGGVGGYLKGERTLVPVNRSGERTIDTSTVQ